MGDFGVNWNIGITETGPEGIARSLWYRRVFGSGAPGDGNRVVRQRGWFTSASMRDVVAWAEAGADLGLGEPIERPMIAGTSSDSSVAVHYPNVSVLVNRYSARSISATVGADTVEEARGVFAALVAKFARVTPTTNEARVKFWFAKHVTERTLSVPTWDEIKGNYHGRTAEDAGWLMEGFTPSSSGQLLLWQGEPGTGKTYALRAMARAWAPWCEIHCITDPELFFGGNTEYLMQVMMAEGGRIRPSEPTIIGRDHLDLDEDDDDPSEDDHAQPKWRLIVLEDAGELVVPDAKQHVGQALSRLLNVADGLLGQGMRTLILITTNEPIGKVHPAVQRPGRCAAKIEFSKLTTEEANAWLDVQQVRARVEKATALADLYALRDGERGTRRVAGKGVTERIGFTATS